MSWIILMDENNKTMKIENTDLQVIENIVKEQKVFFYEQYNP